MAVGAFGAGFGLPALISGVLEKTCQVHLPEWLSVTFLFLGFFAGGITTGLFTEKIIRPRCPQCQGDMRIIKKGYTHRGAKSEYHETYDCLYCGWRVNY